MADQDIEDRISQTLGPIPSGQASDDIEARIQQTLGPASPPLDRRAQPSLRAAPETFNPWNLYPERLLVGAAGTVGRLGDVERSLFPHEMSMFPTRAEAFDFLGRRGLLSGAPLLPENPQGLSGVDRYASALATGVGAAAPLALVGGLEGAAPALVAGGAGGLGSQMGRDLGLGEAPSEVLGLGAGLAAGGGLQYSLGSPTREALDFAAAGLPLRSAALTTSNPATRRLLAKSVPIEATNQDLGQAIERVASGLGESRNWSQAGTKIQELARGWINPVRAADGSIPGDSFPALEKTAWAPLDAKIPPTTLTPQTNFEDLISEMASRGGENQKLVAEAMPSIIQRYNEILKQRGPTGMAPLDSSAGWPSLVAKTPSWEAVKTLRSSIGDMMTRPSVVGSIGQDTLDSMYYALSQDMRSTAERAGALPEFEGALQTSNELRNFKDQVLGKITRSDTGARETVMPEQATKNLQGAIRYGDTSLQLLRHYLPEAADEFAGAHLRLEGLASPDLTSSAVSPSFSNKIQQMETAGVLSSLVPNPADLEALRSSAAIQRRLSDLQRPPSRMERMGLAFTGAAAPIGEALGGAAYSYDPNIPVDKQVVGLLMGGALGGIAGRYAPFLYGASRDALSRSSLAARYAGVEKPGLFPAVAPASLVGATSP